MWMRRILPVGITLLATAGCAQRIDFPPRSPVPCHTECPEPTPEEQNDALPVWNAGTTPAVDTTATDRVL